MIKTTPFEMVFIIRGNMDNHVVITFKTDNKYLHLSACVGENQFTTKVKLESIEKVARYIIQMIRSAR